MTNQRFKVGDRVVVVRTLADELRGQPGTVVFIRSTADFCRVRLDNRRELYFQPSQLDHQKGNSSV